MSRERHNKYHVAGCRGNEAAVGKFTLDRAIANSAPSTIPVPTCKRNEGHSRRPLYRFNAVNKALVNRSRLNKPSFFWERDGLVSSGVDSFNHGMSHVSRRANDARHE